MTRKAFLKKIVITLVFIISMIFFPQFVDAASFSVVTSKSNLKPGESATITVSTDCVGRFNVSCKNGSVSEDKVWIESTSKSFTVTVGQSGVTTVLVSPVNPVSTASGEKVQLNPQSINLNISGGATNPSGDSGIGEGNISGGTTTPSDNANLSNLGIRTYDFKGFKASVTEYNTSVPNEVTAVEVYATVQAKGARYSVSGNKNLQVGTNRVIVTVTAPDGKNSKDYIIYVARQPGEEQSVIPNVIEEPENPEEEPEEDKKEKIGLISIAIEEEYEIYLEPEFKTDVYEYVINLKEDLDSIPLTAIANRENAEVKITGNEGLVEGENVITIEVKDPVLEETTVYKITVNKILQVEEEQKQEEKKEESSFLKENWMIIAAVVVAILLIVISIIGATLMKKNREDRMFFYEENDEIQDEEIEEKEHRGRHF